MSLSLIQSYLADWLQYAVELEGGGSLVKSRSEKIFIGIPQGSILWPLLYIVYVNELSKLISQDIVLYADDTTAIFSGVSG